MEDACRYSVQELPYWMNLTLVFADCVAGKVMFSKSCVILFAGLEYPSMHLGRGGVYPSKCLGRWCLPRSVCMGIWPSGMAFCCGLPSWPLLTRQMATDALGMHPTGMHSCTFVDFLSVPELLWVPCAINWIFRCQSFHRCLPLVTPTARS